MQKLSNFLLVLTILLSGILRTEAQICGQEGDTCYFFGCCDEYECAGSFSKTCRLVEGKEGNSSSTTAAPEGSENPTTTEQPEKVVYTTIKFVTKEYLESNFPGTVWDDADNSSTEASSSGSTTAAVPSESTNPSVEPSGADKTTPSNTQAIDQKTEKHTETDKPLAHKQDHISDTKFNQTSFNSTRSNHTDSGLHSNRTDSGLHSNHTGPPSNHTSGGFNSTHTGGVHLNQTDLGHHSNHSSSSGASPLSSYYFLLYLPFVTTMWYLV